MSIDEELPSIKDFIVNDIDLSLYKYDELLLKKELGTQEVLIKIYDNYNNKFEGNIGGCESCYIEFNQRLFQKANLNFDK